MLISQHVKWLPSRFEHSVYCVVLVNTVELGHSCEVFSVTDLSVMGESQFYEWRCTGIAGMREYLFTNKKRVTHTVFPSSLLSWQRLKGKVRMSS